MHRHKSCVVVLRRRPDSHNLSQAGGHSAGLEPLPPAWGPAGLRPATWSRGATPCTTTTTVAAALGVYVAALGGTGIG